MTSGKRIALSLFLILANAFTQNLVAARNPGFPASSKMNVYFISGLGADKRVFDKLKIDNAIQVNHIQWIKPQKKETIAHYAERLIAQIDTTKPFKLVGLSFGGVIASEISRIVRPEQIVLISSTPVGIPVSAFNRGLIRFFLFSPFAAPILKSTNKYTYKYFGADTPELQALLKAILHDTDSKFLKWALVRMSSWDRKTKADNVYHIHGSADKLIPIDVVKPDLVISGAGHLMVYAQADEISKILNKQLLSK
ncbi:alpha/beta fold hydrolase [Dyadobacter crusticola]|uniref:alpha/beta fold hydrolase n=1 Tax=Dyadobacter crusticola TaxID=292407 RepID=UPI0004E130BF|nr:alpha/beta hydrolase [Dyadobacter crusticola]